MSELEGWKIASSFLFGWSVMATILLFRCSKEKWKNYWEKVQAQTNLTNIRLELAESGVTQCGSLVDQIKGLHNTSKFWEDLYRKEKAKNEGGAA